MKMCFSSKVASIHYTLHTRASSFKMGQTFRNKAYLLVKIRQILWPNSFWWPNSPLIYLCTLFFCLCEHIYSLINGGAPISFLVPQLLEKKNSFVTYILLLKLIFSSCTNQRGHSRSHKTKFSLKEYAVHYSSRAPTYFGFSLSEFDLNESTKILFVKTIGLLNTA